MVNDNNNQSIEEISIEELEKQQANTEIKEETPEEKELQSYYEVFQFLQLHGLLTIYPDEDKNIEYFYRVYDYLKQRKGILLKDLLVLPIPIDTKSLGFVNQMYEKNDLIEWKRKKENEKEDKIYYLNGLLKAIRGLFQEFKSFPQLIKKHGFRVWGCMKIGTKSGDVADIFL